MLLDFPKLSSPSEHILLKYSFNLVLELDILSFFLSSFLFSLILFRYYMFV